MKISKIIKTFFFLTAIIPTFLSCQSSKNLETIPGDSYSEEGLPEVISSTGNENQLSTEENIKNAKKQTSAFQDFFSLGNKDEIMLCETTSFFTKSMTGKPAQKEAVIALNTKNGTAGFGSAYMAAYYYVQMDQNARQKLAKAVEQYLSDFENKRLNRKGKNTFKNYGSISVTLQWGSLKSSTPNNGEGPLYLGYSFENKSPYFTLTAFPIQNNYYEVVGESTTRESLNLKYLFTKAQAQELVRLLSEDKISEYLGLTKPMISVENDEYQE